MLQLALVLAISLASLAPTQAGSASAWLLDEAASRDLEREAAGPLRSPSQILRQASQLFNGRPLEGRQQADEQPQDLFQCVEPTKSQFEAFVRLHNRTFEPGESSSEKLERLTLFTTTLRRTIMLNRVVQNEILNATNYLLRPEQIRNYHFISPTGAQNPNMWYADITDCELGLIKYIVFNIFYLIDQNELAQAYKVALDNSDHLPLLNADGFEQLANILLVRLYDRFNGDEKMDQLFRWPLYLKQLAGYVYNRRQAARPDFKAKLALISYAYPSYFKDIKYNAPAINRTGDNLEAHREHEKFNQVLGRRFASLQERNKRLVIYRQRWSLLSLLNDDEAKRLLNATVRPDWEDLQYHVEQPARSGKILADADGLSRFPADSGKRFRQTQFSDLTDAEFVAFLTNDFSLLDNSEDSAHFIDRNFPIRPLDDQFRNELAFELELRRSSSPSRMDLKPKLASGLYSRAVIDELISDVGLPIGSVVVGNISEQEHYAVFQRLTGTFKKSYAEPNVGRNSRLRLTYADLTDERQKRYEEFKLNYGRFRAWFIKEGWQLNQTQTLDMLRLADMSWTEIKLSLFKICCLTDASLASLASKNATIQYLGSQSQLCQPLTGDIDQQASDQAAKKRKLKARELTALELFYYYSVHFNKHHHNADSFNRRFAIFRKNIDQIRRLSCTRGLTLFAGLELRRYEALNSIDTLNPRRSYTDDINLDRYEYFAVQNLNQPDDSENQPAKLRANYEADYTILPSGAQTRAGISYRRESSFSSLLDEPLGQQQINRPNEVSYPDELTQAARDLDLHALKYRQNAVGRIYDLVMQRYRDCMSFRGTNVATGARQQCQASGPLGDQAATSWLLGESTSSRLQQRDPCGYYREGLEPWAEGLIRQDPSSAQLIQNARCW